MTIEEKTKLFQRFLKELGIYKIYIYDNKICKRENLRDTIEYLDNNFCEDDYDTPSEVINHSLIWADTAHELLWSTLYDYIELEVESWKDLNKNLEGIVKNIKKYLSKREDLDF